MSEIRKPMVLVFAGPNGSGKSTITEWFNVVGKYTNADDMVRTSFLSNEEATKRADDLRYESIRKREDFTFETVLSSDYKIRILKTAKEAGYKTAKEAGYFIKCVFVLTTSANLNVARVKSRVAQGGHDVDPQKIRERYRKSIANIKVLIEICDILHVYDNTNEKPVRIIRKHKDELTVFPNEDWSEDALLSLIED